MGPPVDPGRFERPPSARSQAAQMHFGGHPDIFEHPQGLDNREIYSADVFPRLIYNTRRVPATNQDLPAGLAPSGQKSARQNRHASDPTILHYHEPEPRPQVEPLRQKYMRANHLFIRAVQSASHQGLVGLAANSAAHATLRTPTMRPGSARPPSSNPPLVMDQRAQPVPSEAVKRAALPGSARSRPRRCGSSFDFVGANARAAAHTPRSFTAQKLAAAEAAKQQREWKMRRFEQGARPRVFCAAA